MVPETTHLISSTIVNNAALLNDHYQLNVSLNNIGALLGLPSLELKVIEAGWFTIDHQLGVRPICQHNYENNRMVKEPRIMLE